jgi:hypothetical protein
MLTCGETGGGGSGKAPRKSRGLVDSIATRGAGFASSAGSVSWLTTEDQQRTAQDFQPAHEVRRESRKSDSMSPFANAHRTRLITIPFIIETRRSGRKA